VVAYWPVPLKVTKPDPVEKFPELEPQLSGVRVGWGHWAFAADAAKTDKRKKETR